ncbi:hypothetical protein [Nocardioides eburneiflavus]|uniref:hypothetical protein n=1 Tax=Nocardioides eburneiflavus TaxID=2518372 RepID=UPI00143D3AE3|nr:hypothetical protein [Nocardioides eburneiflavus]
MSTPTPAVLADRQTLAAPTQKKAPRRTAMTHALAEAVVVDARSEDIVRDAVHRHLNRH